MELRGFLHLVSEVLIDRRDLPATPEPWRKLVRLECRNNHPWFDVLIKTRSQALIAKRLHQRKTL
jgi:hypothetical protein